MRVAWSLAVVGLFVVSACAPSDVEDAGDAADVGLRRTGTRTVLRAVGAEEAVIEAITIGDAGTAALTVDRSVVAEEIRVGGRYFARVGGADAVLGFDRWISFDLADPAEAATARRIGPGLLDLIDGGSFDGYDVVHRVLQDPPRIEAPSSGAHVPIASVPEVVMAGS